MSEPARNTSLHDTAGRPSTPTGPLRDWLAAMRATASESWPTDVQTPEPATVATSISGADSKGGGWAPRLVVSSDKPEAHDDEIADLVAENMMLRAKLRLEADRRDELQLLLAQEIRELRAHITDEIAKFEDLRGERDLWKARCEALIQPLFSGQTR